MAIDGLDKEGMRDFYGLYLWEGEVTSVGRTSPPPTIIAGVLAAPSKTLKFNILICASISPSLRGHGRYRSKLELFTDHGFDRGRA